MASTVMHIAVAEELYKKIKENLDINYYDYILGAIAPDLSKLLNTTRTNSHFLIPNTETIDIDKFLNKYKTYLTNSFTLGYYIHLFADKLFYEDYYPLFIKDNFLSSVVKTLDNEVLKISKDERKQLLYNDYTNLNISLIEEYNLTLDIFYNEYVKPTTQITEIPIDKLPLLIDNAGIIIQKLKTKKDYILDISSIKAFIDDCVTELYSNLLNLNLI